MLCFPLLTADAASQELTPSKPVAGNWPGALEAKGFKLRLVLTGRTANDLLLDSQTNNNLPRARHSGKSEGAVSDNQFHNSR